MAPRSIVTPKSNMSTLQHNSESKVPRPHSKRRKARSVLRRWRELSFRHTWVNPLVLSTIILSAYMVNPTPSNPLHSAIFLSYAVPPSDGLIPSHVRRGPDAPTQYGKGPRDLAFVAFYIVVLSFTREFLMQRLIRPLAIFCNIRARGKQSRFMEQVYTAIYFAVFGPYGLYVMSRTPVWYFDTVGMFEDFPHRTHEGVFKAYYLLQASYWAQQAIVLCLQLEKPRKDFRELVGHHIVTLALIGLSYRFHFTYIGLAVYVTHDISDFFLAVSVRSSSLDTTISTPRHPKSSLLDSRLTSTQTSKTLNYINSPLTVPYFALFIGVWVYLRHYINLAILYATLTTFRTVGPFELDWAAQQYKCWISQYVTFGLLACLQAINLFWLFLIVRISWRIVFSREVEDVRSDNEDDDEDVAVAGVQHGGTAPTSSSSSALEDKKAAANIGMGGNHEKEPLKENISAPQLLLNGKPVATKGEGRKSAENGSIAAAKRKSR